MKSPVESTHYFTSSYNTKERFISYWHQINEIIILKPESILEIGIGNGLVANFLRQRGLKVTTMDIDERLYPDYVGSVLDIPFPNESFEVVACFEVLEHLPYEGFPTALHEIHRVTKKHAVMSLPDCKRAYRFDVQIPKLGEVKFLIPLPRLKAPIHTFNGEHYWEIGKAGYSLSKIINDIQRAGFIIDKTYRVFEHPYYRFFILRKIKDGKYGGRKG